MNTDTTDRIQVKGHGIRVGDRLQHSIEGKWSRFSTVLAVNTYDHLPNTVCLHLAPGPGGNFIADHTFTVDRPVESRSGALDEFGLPAA